MGVAYTEEEAKALAAETEVGKTHRGTHTRTATHIDSHTERQVDSRTRDQDVSRRVI